MATWWRNLIPSKNDRELRRLEGRLAPINALADAMEKLSDDALQQRTATLRQQFDTALRALGGRPEAREFMGTHEEKEQERRRLDAALDTILPEAFATCREASRRVLGLRHYDVQLLGGMVLHEGKIAEMKTGEGKTLVATLAVYLNALAGRGVHVVTVNEYLASRDAEWMGRLYQFLGMECGIILSGLSDAQRQAAYRAPITYGTNSEFGFDFLRDNMKMSLHDYVQRGMNFAIVDEVDSILIDEARTPLIISGPAEDSTDKYARINGVIPGLMREQDYTVDEKARAVVLTEGGVQTVERRLQVDNLYEPENIEILHHVNQALRAHTLFRRDVDYMVEDGRVKIIDEFTGRVLDGRRWSDGLHQAVEAKEGVHVENENQTLATITYQNYFRNFLKLGGMTGTAETEAEEFAKIYDLDVVAMPTNRPMVREDLHDVIYKSEREKFDAIVAEIQERAGRGQPVLVGTISVEKSEALARHLRRLNIPHHVLNAKYHRQEANIIAQAGRPGSVTIATNMAGRGTDILLGGNPEALAREQLQAEGIEADPGQVQARARALKASCARDKETVLAAGGLHILGTERHESRRIDNQLRGRAGRQGDPGSSRFFISLEDDLMRIFGGDRLMGIMERLGMQDGEVIEHPLVNRSIENAQRRVEGHNFDLRKHLLEYDDVVNAQRSAVYKRRRRALGADIAVMREMLLSWMEQCVENLVQQACPERTPVGEWTIDALPARAQELFASPVHIEGVPEGQREPLEDAIFAAAEAGLAAREQQFGAEPFFQIARLIAVQSIDMLWKDHLRDMEQLREGISLRGYAQKDPKQEYKKEGFNLFAAMMGHLAADIVQKVFRVVITAESQAEYEARLAANAAVRAQLARASLPPSTAVDTATGENSSGAGHAGGMENVVHAGTAATASAKLQSVRRAGPKVGRNDPCPCGSGKKYKKCHMESDPPQH